MEPTNDNASKSQEIKVTFTNPQSNAVGICALIFSIISVFFFAIFFMPIALILAIIALVKKQYVWGICALIVCVISFSTSPTLLMLFYGLTR